MKTLTLSLVLMALAMPAHGATFTVTNTDDSGAGTLRQAIVNANANPGLDTIAFNIPPDDGSVKTISITNTLTGISSPVIIDGYTQPGASANTLTQGSDAVLLIEVTTSNNSQGIIFQANGCTVRGLVINGFFQGVAFQAAAQNNVVEGCFIGTDPTGTSVSPRATTTGINCPSANNRIGGPLPSQINVISGTTGTAISVVNSTATDNVIENNRIGISALNAALIPNQVGLDIASPDTTISNNLIYGNVSHGVVIQTIATGTRLFGNNISLNGGAGILVQSAANQIGAATGTIPGPLGNFVTENAGDQIRLSGTFASANVIEGNLIAREGPGGSRGNHGVAVVSGAHDNLIAGNTIANNRMHGVHVDTSSSSNTISANAISGSGQLGINLGVDAVSVNDGCDADSGANTLQNFPVLTAATSAASILTISGILDSAPDKTHTLEFFANASCDASGHGEAASYIGAASITTPANCANSFSAVFPIQLAAGTVITATATDPAGNTSEFSACEPVVFTPDDGPQIACPADIVANTATNVCSQTVAFEVAASGTPTPVVTCEANGGVVTSPATFPLGVSTVQCTASNTAGVARCEFTVTVNDEVLPEAGCPSTVIVNAPTGATSAIVQYSGDSHDNCPGHYAVIEPPSGSTFALGTHAVTVTAFDAAGNTDACTFDVVVQGTPPRPHDLALIGLRAPKNINLKGAAPSLTKRVTVRVQNRSSHLESIPDLDTLREMVTVDVHSLGLCVTPQAVLIAGPPNKTPRTLKPGQKMNVFFEVTYTCANDPAKGVDHKDYQYTAAVHHAALDGQSDAHQDDDDCPRAPLAGGIDQAAGLKIKDRGCAGKAPVLTDAFVRRPR